MANELKYHMNMLNSIDKKVGGPGNWTYIIDALNSIDQGLTSYIPDQKQEIVDELNDAISEIQATGEAVNASIPSDYTALTKKVNALTTNVRDLEDTVNGLSLYLRVDDNGDGMLMIVKG